MNDHLPSVYIFKKRVLNYAYFTNSVFLLIVNIFLVFTKAISSLEIHKKIISTEDVLNNTSSIITDIYSQNVFLNDLQNAKLFFIVQTLVIVCLVALSFQYPKKIGIVFFALFLVTLDMFLCILLSIKRSTLAMYFLHFLGGGGYTFSLVYHTKFLFNCILVLFFLLLQSFLLLVGKRRYSPQKTEAKVNNGSSDRKEDSCFIDIFNTHFQFIPILFIAGISIIGNTIMSVIVSIPLNQEIGLTILQLNIIFLGMVFLSGLFVLLIKQMDFSTNYQEYSKTYTFILSLTSLIIFVFYSICYWRIFITPLNFRYSFLRIFFAPNMNNLTPEWFPDATQIDFFLPVYPTPLEHFLLIGGLVICFFYIPFFITLLLHHNFPSALTKKIKLKLISQDIKNKEKKTHLKHKISASGKILTFILLVGILTFPSHIIMMKYTPLIQDLHNFQVSPETHYGWDCNASRNLTVESFTLYSNGSFNSILSFDLFFLNIYDSTQINFISFDSIVANTNATQNSFYDILWTFNVTHVHLLDGDIQVEYEFNTHRNRTRVTAREQGKFVFHGTLNDTKMNIGQIRLLFVEYPEGETDIYVRSKSISINVIEV